MSPDAVRMWVAGYAKLSTNGDGLVDKLTARAEPYVLRIALIYALLDEVAEIEPRHLTAALALWQYVMDSTVYIFGDATGNPVADSILRALHDGPLSQSAINDTLGGHVRVERIDAALTALMRAGRIRSSKVRTAGRSRTDWEVIK
jgi:hypothetical protein